MTTIDLTAAADFMAGNARLLDWRRFELLMHPGDPAAANAVLDALAGYRNPDGGYGHGLEPDLRSTESQPGSTAHAFEVFEEAASVTTSPDAVKAFDWLATASLPDGGVPFALPVSNPVACAPFWANADPTVSHLQISAFVTTHAHRLAAVDEAVAGHPWLERATDYCLDAIRRLDDEPFAIVLAFCVQFLDVVYESRPEAAELLEKLARHIPPDGRVPVVGGAEGETMRALSFAPEPGRPVRELFRQDVIDAELEQLASEQHDDGGWRVDFHSYSPAATLEWSGYQTVSAIRTLRLNGLT